MAWIYLAVSGDSLSHSSHGSEPSLIVKTTHTLKVFYCRECGMNRFHEPQSGRMSKLFREKCCENFQRLTLYSVASPARTLVMLELESVWRESEAGFSLKSQDWLGSFDRPSYSWRTSQLSLLEDASESLWNSFRWATIVDGRLYQPKRLEPVTSEKDGSFLPTPTAKEGGYNRGGGSGRVGKIRPTLSTLAKTLPTPLARDWKGAAGKNRNSKDLPRTMGGSLNPQFVEELMGYRIGWTELEGWVTQWFRSKRGKRSKD